MAQYPRTQAQIASLADSLIGGFTAHPQDFPHADVPSLETARDEFIAASNTLTDAESAVAVAAKEKLEKLQRLEVTIKTNIKMASVDCGDDPEKLAEICWGPKRAPQPIAPPGQPTNLAVIAQSEDTVFLNWCKAARKAGGPVRTYIIERRSNNQDWTLVSTALNNEAKLEKQPTGCKLEYRVKAINSSGESMPSNTVGVVL
jgi:hypothetical protein